MAYAIENTSAQTEVEDIEVINLSALAKKRFRIDLGDGDTTRILALNVTDMGVVNRLSEGYNRLVALEDKTQHLGDSATDNSDDTEQSGLSNSVTVFAERLKEIDAEMRSVLDFIFDSNVCEVCCPFGSMYDPVNGKLRYEHIIDALMGLYSSAISDEMEKTKKHIQSHTAKYTKKNGK